MFKKCIRNDRMKEPCSPFSTLLHWERVFYPRAGVFQKFFGYPTKANAAALIGAAGEMCAERYLKKDGYKIRERNVRFGRYEIDLIVFDAEEQMVVFVEVKTRSTHTDAYPIHTALHQRKRRALRKAVAEWVRKNDYHGPGRIDLLSIYEGNIVEHVKDVGSDFY